MKTVHKSLLLWHSAQQMYDLVTAIQDYPAFLPWCDRAELLETREDGMTARLGLSFSGLHHSFTTRNTHVPGRAVRVELVDGPFSMLEGTWSFKPLGADDAPEPACRIEFDLRYAFHSPALESVVGPVFDRIANTLVDRFVQRAEEVYGAR